MAKYISENEGAILKDCKSFLELGAATGALSLWLTSMKFDSFVGTTTDYDDGDDNEIGENIINNFKINDIESINHIRHSWGEPLEELSLECYDIIFASDILIYVSQYGNLVKSIVSLFERGSKQFVMSFNRPNCKEEALKFFNMMNQEKFITQQPSKGLWIFTRQSENGPDL